MRRAAEVEQYSNKKAAATIVLTLVTLALDIHRGIVQTGVVGPPKYFKGEHFKFRFKIQRICAYNFRVRETSRNLAELYQATCRKAGVMT